MAPVSGRRESSRLLDVSSRRILDEGTRIRRLNRQLEALEKDNFQEDPHAQYEHSKKKRPKFDIESEEETVKDTLSSAPTTQKGKKKRTRGDHFKQRFRKNFNILLDEEKIKLKDEPDEKPNYFTANAPESRYPQRHFCAVCGHKSPYTCISCGSRYCSVHCLETHRETRCLKWTV